MNKPVIACPDCGAIVEYSFGSFKCEECGWLLSEPEFEDVLDEDTLKRIRYHKLKHNRLENEL
jgi:tRNA(Ile2) C34 agmatinyltransferase TiaS